MEYPTTTNAIFIDYSGLSGNGSNFLNNTFTNYTGFLGNDSESYYYYYYYEYYYDVERKPYTKYIVDIEIPIIGYVFPVLAIPTIILNLLVILVFSKKSMRNPTSTLLIALAIADSVVCFSILPASFYFFIEDHYKSYLVYKWCVGEYSLYVIQRMFRTFSNWITVALGAQRFIIVCYPFKAKRICTLKTALLSIVAALVASVCIHLLLAIGVEIYPFPVTAENATFPDGCRRQIAKWYSEIVVDVAKSQMIFYIFSGLLSRFLPCLLLSVTTIMLVYKLKTRKREIGQCVNKTSSAESFRRISKLVLVVMTIFLIAEMQDAFAYAILVYEYASHSTRAVLTEEQSAAWSAIGMLMSLVGYLCNFWIYILMSRQFRVALFGFLTGQTICKPRREDKTQTTFLNSSPSTKTKIYCNSDSGRNLLDKAALTPTITKRDTPSINSESSSNLLDQCRRKQDEECSSENIKC